MSPDCGGGGTVRASLFMLEGHLDGILAKDRVARVQARGDARSALGGRFWKPATFDAQEPQWRRAEIGPRRRGRCPCLQPLLHVVSFAGV